MSASTTEILSVKLDFLFKLIFGDERNVDILINFLSAILDMPPYEFEELHFVDTAVKKEHEDDKLGILDVNVKTASGVLINLEIQIINKRDFEKRTLYYTSKRFAEQLGEGHSYIELNQTISINIIDFNLFPYEKYHSTFWLTEETEPIKLTDAIRIDFLELKKANKAKNKPSDNKTEIKQLWMDFLNAKSREELIMLSQKNAVFERPVAEVLRLSEDASVRELHFKRQMAIMDRIAEREYALEQGYKEGIEKGMAAGMEKGMAAGIEKGMVAGIEKGMEKGIAAGIEKGMAAGIEKGFEQGIEKGLEQGIEKGLEQGIEKGLELGLEKGRAKAFIGIVNIMKNKGIAIKDISEYTGLTVSELEHLILNENSGVE